MSFGLMGGGMQPQGHTQMMVRMADYGLGPQGAIDGPRFRVVQAWISLSRTNGPSDDCGPCRAGTPRDEAPEINNAFGCAQIGTKLEDGYLCASDARRDSLPVGSERRSGADAAYEAQAGGLVFQPPEPARSPQRCSPSDRRSSDNPHDALDGIEPGPVQAPLLEKKRCGDHDGQPLHDGALADHRGAETFSRYRA